MEWKKLSEEAKKFGYRTLVFKNYQLPNGKTHEFTTYGKATDRSVQVIALTPDNQIIVARQFRVGPERVFDELPGGDADPGEAPEKAAARELLEETGYQADRLEPIGTICRDAYSNVLAYYYIGYDCKKIAEPSLDEAEYVETSLISIEQLFENARTTKMGDAGGVFLAYERLKGMVQS